MKLRAVYVFALCLPSAGARAGEPVERPAPTLDPASVPARAPAAILADVVKAMGAEAAWKAHKTVHMKLEMSFQGMGISGAGEHFATKDDKSLVVTDLPGVGTIREGSNGKVCWAQDPINGMRLLAGAEAEQARVESVWNPELRMAELYKSIESKTETGAGGAALECLVLTPHEGTPVTNCYDAKSHLQVSQKGTRATPQGDTPFTSTLKDWREVGGMKMPFAVETQAGPITFTARVTEVKYDVPVTDKMFEPPGGGDDAPAKAGGKGKGKAKAKPAAP